MKPKLFPNRFTIQLEEEERSALEDLYDLDPLLLDEIELLHKVIRAGIKVRNQEVARQRKNPHLRGPTRTQIETQNKSEASAERVENYVCLPLEERLRQKLEGFLRHESAVMSQEEALALLLHLGLRTPEGA